MRDLQKASAAIERATAINEKIEAERRRIIQALNRTIVVVCCLSLLGVWALSEADKQLHKKQLDQQEQITWRK